MSDHIDTDVAHDEGWAIAIISNVDAPEVGWPHQTEEWRTAARSWLDAVHAPADPMSEQQTDDQAERGAETMNDRSLELVIREQLTAMGVSNAYHRAAAIAKAIQSSEEPTPAFFTQLAADAIDSAYRSGWNEAIDRLSALPDPAPRGLSEEDAVLVDLVRACGASNGSRKPTPLQPFMCKRVADLLDRLSALPDSERPEGERTVLSFDKYEAEKVMDPILRRWFAMDLDPIDVERNAENAAVDLSWGLEAAGLLGPFKCRHAIYHHGCPSCDRQDPEDR